MSRVVCRSCWQYWYRWGSLSCRRHRVDHRNQWRFPLLQRFIGRAGRISRFDEGDKTP